MTKKTLQRRAKQAEALEKRALNVWKSLDKIPSYTGKASFMDKVKGIHILAHNMRFNLNGDLADFDKISR